MRILLVEDSPSDAAMLAALLKEVEPDGIAMTHATRLGSALGLPDEPAFDVILLDLNLPDSIGLETVAGARQRWPGMPIVVRTGTAESAAGLQSLRHGAQDYIVKDEFDGGAVLRAIRYAIERHRLSVEAEQQAHCDPVTGLVGRGPFVHRLKREVAQAEKLRARLALHVIGVDSFKPVTDRFGHGMGDLLLRVAAHRLGDGAGAGATLARFGADEFAALQCGCREPAEAHTLARKLLAVLSPPVELNKFEVAIGASVGTAIYPDHAADAHGLIDRAVAELRASHRSTRQMATAFSTLRATPMRCGP